MSKPRHHWYGFVKNLLKRYPSKLQAEETVQNYMALYAINQAIEETRKLEDGEERIAIVTMLYFKNTHTFEGVANQVHLSPQTVKRRSNDFIYCVAKHMGYL